MDSGATVCVSISIDPEARSATVDFAGTSAQVRCHQSLASVPSLGRKRACQNRASITVLVRNLTTMSMLSKRNAVGN